MLDEPKEYQAQVSQAQIINGLESKKNLFN